MQHKQGFISFWTEITCFSFTVISLHKCYDLLKFTKKNLFQVCVIII